MVNKKKPMTIWKRLVTQIKTKEELTQEQISQIIGTSPQSLSMIVNGYYAPKFDIGWALFSLAHQVPLKLDFTEAIEDAKEG